METGETKQERREKKQQKKREKILSMGAAWSASTKMLSSNEPSRYAKKRRVLNPRECRGA